MKIRHGCCLLFFLTTSFLSPSAQNQPPPPVAVRCGHLLDVRTGKILHDQVIVISGDRIKAIGPSSSTPAPAGAQIIDLHDATVLPGLIDAHTHLIGDDKSFDEAEPLKKSAAQMAYEAIPHARSTLLAGFTSVRDVGTYRAFVDVALRNAIDAGTVPGPRMDPAGAYVTISGGAGDVTGFAEDIELPRDLRYGVADSPDEVRERVRLIIRHGAGVIKILATGAVLTLSSQPGAQEMTYDEMRAAVEEASKAGLKVACHAHGAAGAKDAIRAGVASIEHGSFLDEEDLQMMKQRGTYLVPDMYDDTVIMQQPPGYPNSFIQKERAAGQSQIKVVKRALELGVKIAFGTDAGVYPHGDNGKQFAVYTQNGMTPIYAIQTATVNAADLLGWSDRVGSIEPGRFADIIAVRGNPLEDIRTLEHVAFVMKGGQVYKNDFVPASIR
jgi:imidazolonepropionase-like amidohydrolase